MPKGGPDGGDGGRGGDVVLVCDDSLRDLRGLSPPQRTSSAGRGGHGEGALRHGADGETLEITGAARHRDRGLRGRRRPEHDLGLPPGPARGRRPRRLGRHAATSASPAATHQTPRFAERGLPGEEGWLTLQLKLLADVGLVGLPNAGKSSLLSRLTRAHPKIADYPFTTLSPVLGTLEGEERQLVIADIPGLIEGASEGAGLGHDFLAHVERTRLLVHVLDLAPRDRHGRGADAAANHATIERELAAHDPRLASLPRILALSKADLVDAGARPRPRSRSGSERMAARGAGDRRPRAATGDRPRTSCRRADSPGAHAQCRRAPRTASARAR